MQSMPCAFSNVQCKLLSSIHAAKYRVIAHNLGYIAVLHNCIYVSSIRQLAVVVIIININSKKLII